ncbi:MAG: nickel-dependent lactate racemase [Chloroflexi bacterium]|nr:MAG: nickel-dependent lactate racemase [Chloroflexota bacterium]
MKISMPYGRSSITVTLPDDRPVDIIEAPAVPPAPEPLEVVRTALDCPLGGISLSTFAGAKSVGIAVSDKTRPIPHQHLLPPLLEKLEALGIPAQAITLYVAVGTHQPMTSDEFPSILPASVLDRYRVVSHDASDHDNLVFLGETSRGTPMWANKGYTHSDLKIVVGNIEPHQFAGFSGGVKSAAIGLGGMETITYNHALMTHPDAQLGAYETNPPRQDIEEIGQKIGIHFACNAVLNQSKKIVHVLTGEPRAVMQAGIPLSKQVCQVGVVSKYNLMISSPGGHPKDINIYQAQKGLAHAALVTNTGGTIILAAACPEGTGSPHYQDWMLGKSSYEDVFKQFSEEGFQIGPHKAYQIARDASQVHFMFFSDIDINLSNALLLNPITDLQSALNSALATLKPGEHVGFLPHASTTIPYLMG